MPTPPDLGPVLILAPVGRDDAEIARVLEAIGVRSRLIGDVVALSHALHPDGGAGAAALVIAEEAFAGGMDGLVGSLADQPPWSDLPIVLLTSGGSRRGPARRWAVFEALGNVTLLGRPLHSETLQSAVRAALRARARQHETRQHLDALRVAAETLEERVNLRTQELMQMEQALRQSQKMEAVGQLTGGLAHDFNNMLAGITGSLELLERRIAQGRLGDVPRYVSAAQDGARRAAALTHRLLAFSRRQTLDPRPTDANRLIDGMRDLIQRTVGPEIGVETELTNGVNTTLCDPNQLENALLNLCINARDAMPHGGRLVIAAHSAWEGEAAAREQGIAPGCYISISVTDTGSGMEPDVVARAFDPFFTTKPLGQGTGLGLSMIYGFARQSKGAALIRSVVGKGTKVQILLPHHHLREEGRDEKVARPVLPGAAGTGTVLVVDDEATVRMLLAELLGDMGYRVIEAEDGAAGMEVLRSATAIDLLVTDVGLPGGMNGRQVADAAQDLRPGLQVLFITGYAESAVLSDGNLPAGMHVMTKPFGMNELSARIRGLVAVS